VDIDARKINDLYPAVIGIVADAGTTAAALLEALGKDQQPRTGTEREVAALKKSIDAALSAKERQHCRLLEVLREVLPADSIVMGDICQPVYSGVFAFEVDQPRLWHYPGGYCTLGCALPDAIGAKLALPERPVIALAGDGGFMFTVQELMTAVELQLPIPIVLWNNRGYQQIRDGMNELGITPVGVDGINPDFIRLAQACGARALRCSGAAVLAQAVSDALTAAGPTLIEIREDDAWLLD
jgi:thiamine pyrophosphate-dependent acetolactate synthase large subunit-like protein